MEKTQIPLTHKTKDHTIKNTPTLWDLDEHINQYAKLAPSQFYTKLYIHLEDLERSNYPLDTLTIHQDGIVCKLSHINTEKGCLLFESLMPKFLPQTTDTLNDAKEKTGSL